MKTRVLGMSGLVAAGVAAASIVAAPAANADAPYVVFGAVSVSPSTGATGWAVNYRSAAAAERASNGSCNRWDCRSLVTFQNSCGAIADNGFRYTGGWGRDKIPAQNDALRRGGWGSSVIVWACTDR